jgi:ectoine hydroxylase-related dioxygenase (phytanoyl-CoA dioxygenase family)
LLTDQQLDQFRRRGHLTIPSFFTDDEIEAALADVDAWSRQFLATLTAADHRWYAEQQTGSELVLRKLDNPVFHRDLFRQLAKKPELVEIVEQIIGAGVSVFFSQVFMKPPEVGGPKPVHQDNYYFGPDDLDATLTVWIALDDATTENGCLYYSDVHQQQVLAHTAPAAEPFNLQIDSHVAAASPMVAAPVPRGGISLHHGNTLHQSSSNRSKHPRRAAAFHYLRNSATLVHPALEYDRGLNVCIS